MSKEIREVTIPIINLNTYKTMFGLNTMVAVSIKDVNNNIRVKKGGRITEIRTIKGVTEYKVNGEWEDEKNLKEKKMKALSPTIEQMRIVKDSYPILKKGDVKVFYEIGDKYFAISWKKGKDSGYLLYNGKEFNKIDNKMVDSLILR